MGLNRVIEKLASRTDHLPCPVAVHTPDETTTLGDGEPEVHVHVRNGNGLQALSSLDQLRIIEAYVRGELDIEGDMIKAMSFQDFLGDNRFWIKAWRKLQPALLGRPRCNPEWIQKHYDSNNLQLLVAERDFHTYTPGIYESDDDTMEQGARRKLQFAFDALGLQPGDRVLDVGCGWGGFIRFCARRGVRVTGITLSRDQHRFTQEKIREEEIDAEVLYQDFFTYEPETRYDGISMMGVIEDLSDYPAIVDRVRQWVEPGRGVYLDFASANDPDPTASFITKYVWPGAFRMVYLPELISAVVESPFEIASLHNDRRNYHLWARKGFRRWLDCKAEAVERAGEEVWRLWTILFAGTASVMDRPSREASAYRMVLELPDDVPWATI